MNHKNCYYLLFERLTSVRNYDSIVVMEKGAIIATGTHATLMETCGLYREIVKREG